MWTPGARVQHHVRQVITNLSAFERVPTGAVATKEAQVEWDETPSRPLTPFSSDSAKDLVEAGTPSPYGGKCSTASHRLVIQPRHDPADMPHDCPMCPANLCKVRLLPLPLRLL